MIFLLSGQGMERISLFFLLFFFVPSGFSAQHIRLSEQGTKTQQWQYILSQENDWKDTVRLKKFLSPLLQKNKPSLKIIYQVLLANGYTRFYDRTNSESEFLYASSISSAKELGNDPLEIWTKLNYAKYLYNYRQMTEALPIFMAAIDQIDKMDAAKLIFPAQSFKIIGYYMGTIGDKNSGNEYLLKALQYCSTNCKLRAEILDNLGLTSLDLGNFKLAENYFKEASEMAKKIKDDLRYAKTLGNLAQIEAHKKNYHDAIALLKEDIKISNQEQAEQNTMFALTLLGKYQVEADQLQEAERTLQKADSISKLRTYYQISQLEIVKILMKLYKNEGRAADELVARRRAEILESNVLKTDGELPLKQANWMAQKSRYQANIDETNLKLHRELLWKNGLAFMAILIITWAILVWLKTRRDAENQLRAFDEKQEEHLLEKQNYEQQLQEVHQTLKSQVEFFKDKNIQIQQLQKEIENLRKSKSSDWDEKSDKLNELLQTHLMTSQNWQNFRKEFQREYPDFYHTLYRDFPEITESNLRIILLQKLGFNNVEVSSLLGITPDAVKKSKQRLKRKLGDKSEALFSRISNN